MFDYPVNLQLAGRLCVVVGGGTVGLRKLRGLLDAGARVRLVSPTPLPDWAALLEVEQVARPFLPEDVTGALLVFAATDDAAVNAAVAQAARRAGALVSLADAPQQGDFTLPAVLRRGGLSLAVATAGGSPALAALLRDQLAEDWGPEWGTVLELVAALRRRRLTHPGNPEYNQAILRDLLDGGLVQLIAAGDAAAVDALLGAQFGADCSLAALAVQL